MAECLTCGAERDDIVDPTRTCPDCVELRKRMERDPELAWLLLQSAFEERAKRSIFSPDLRAKLLEIVGTLEVDQSGTKFQDLFDMAVSGVRGLTTYSDENLLTEYLYAIEAPEGNVDRWGQTALEEALWAELRNLPLYAECVAKITAAAKSGGD